MRTIKEYYKKALDEHNNWLYSQKDKWWEKENESWRAIKGDYIETVNFLTDEEKNNSSLFHNHTNIKNSEWGILFSMLGQALVDWCVENVNWESLWSFSIGIERSVDGLTNFYECSHVVKTYDFKHQHWVEVEDESELEKFDGCDTFLCSIVDWFMAKHGKDVPNDWNYFGFGLDELMESCRWGEWVCSSDGYINLGNYSDIDNDEYDLYVECM